MPLTAELVAGTDPAALLAAGADCDALAEALSGRAAALSEARGSGSAKWRGFAANSAELALVLDRVRVAAAAEQFRVLASLLVQAAEELRTVRAEVRAVLTEAAAAGCTVSGRDVLPGPSGPLPGRAPGTGPTRGAGPAAGGTVVAAALAVRLRAALDAAERTDAGYAAALARSAGQASSGEGLDPKTSHAALLAAAALIGDSFPPPGSSPARVHAWWLRLDPTEQRMLLRDQPQLVGGLDGVPAVARDRANRVLLDQLLFSTAGEPVHDALLRIRDRLARQRGASPPALLLSLGLEGQGRAVLSFGDPDLADHVCVYVPGMGTRLADVAGKDGDRALAVHDAAVAAAPDARPGSTASMVWLGYDAPLDLAAVAGDGRAAAGAAPYDHFLAGLRATRLGPPARLTALGHSYGSLLVGLAARRPGGTGADDLVLIGSPGTGAAHASELGVAPGRVWAGAAEKDPVSSLLPSPRQGALLAVGSVLGGVVPPLDTLVGQVAADRGTAWFGTNPAAPSFGARPLPVDAGSGPGGGLAGAHSHYLDRDSSTLAAIGRIVTGRHR